MILIRFDLIRELAYRMILILRYFQCLGMFGYFLVCFLLMSLSDLADNSDDSCCHLYDMRIGTALEPTGDPEYKRGRFRPKSGSSSRAPLLSWTLEPR